MKRLGILSNLPSRAPDALDRGDNWRAGAACAAADDPEIWFAVGEMPAAQQQTADAKRICYRCPVKDACLRWALDTRQDVGVWGGLDERERARIHRRRPSHNAPAKPRRTPESVLAAKSATVTDGHVVWQGTQPVFVNGEEYTAPQLAWFVAYGVRPVGHLTVGCGHPGCIRADHRLDQAGRDARHGTRAAYLAHRRRNEPACEPCLAANRRDQEAAATA